MFELLAILPEQNETHRIQRLRYKHFSDNQNLQEHEKNLIGALIADEEIDRPMNIQEVIEVTEILKDRHQGNIVTSILSEQLDFKLTKYPKMLY